MKFVKEQLGGFLLVFIVVFCLVGFALGQDVTPPAPGPSIHGTQAKLALKDIQLLVAKRALIESNYKLLQAQMKLSEKEYVEASGRLNTSIEDLYHDLGISRTEYDINIETGELIKLTPPQAPTK